MKKRIKPTKADVVLLRRAVLKLAPTLLEMAGESFGDHGCNDFDYSEHGLTKDEQKAFVTYLNEQNGSPDNAAEDIAHLPNGHDFTAMYACAAWLTERATELPGIGQEKP